MKTILITGGCGFIGINAARYFMENKWQVILLDNLSRRGADKNLVWLTSLGTVECITADIRDQKTIEDIFKRSRFDVILHLAAQVAVTTSIQNPREDFEINAWGTFNILDVMRCYQKEALLIYASTNKVYGKMDDLGIVERGNRYAYKNSPGVDESRALDFHSPYGCSKGAGDQYVIDHARIYNLRATSFRQSCIYGPRQFGIEDQGWVAWFTIAAVLGKKITIYGDGKQVRDILHVRDLILAYQKAIDQPERVAGKAFNVGGGEDNVISLFELIALLEEKLNKKIPLSFEDWRAGDQPVFICSLEKMKKTLGWKPQTGVPEGIAELIEWVQDNKDMLSTL